MNNIDDIEIVNNDNLIIHSNDIEEAIYDACIALDISDLKNEGQRPWKAVLALVGKRLFPDRRELKQHDNIYNNGYINTTYNAYNYELLDYICDYYINVLSNKYNKLVSTVAYSLLINVPTNTIDVWKDTELNSPTFKIWQKLHVARQECLKDKCYDNNNVVGTITLGNNEYGWNSPYVAPSKREKVVSIGQLEDVKPLEIESKE